MSLGNLDEGMAYRSPSVYLDMVGRRIDGKGGFLLKSFTQAEKDFALIGGQQSGYLKVIPIAS